MFEACKNQWGKYQVTNNKNYKILFLFALLQTRNINKKNLHFPLFCEQDLLDFEPGSRQRLLLLQDFCRP